jgi:tetratricopeptide (TPR) repeat protein
MEDFIQLVKKTNPEAKIKVKDGCVYIKGDIYLWYLLDKVTLPDNLKVDGGLHFGDDCIDVLPKGLEVAGLLIFLYSDISEIPADLKTYSLCLSGTQIKKLPDNMNYFKGSLSLSNSKIKELPPNLTVGGNLNVMHTSLKKLPENLKVGNTLTLSDCRLLDNTIGLKTKNLSFAYSNIKSLPFALKLRGTLDLSDSEIECLPDNMRIGGDLILKNCKNIKSLPKGLHIGGTLDISNSGIKTLPDDIIIRNKKRKKEPDYSGLVDHKYKEEDIKVAAEYRERASKESDSKVLEKLHRGFLQDYPNNPFAYEELMSYYFHLGKYDKVEAIYKKACVKYLVSPAMQYIIGCSYYKKGDYKFSYHYADLLFDNFQLEEQSSILLFNTLYCLIKNNTEEQYPLSKKLFDEMKDVERRYCRYMGKSDDMEYYRKLLKTIKIDLTENKKLTKNYNIFRIE